MDTMQQLRLVFEDTFSMKFPRFDAAVSQEDVEPWDSVHHVMLLLAIERHFAITFSAEELGDLDNVGAIRDIVESKRHA